MGIISTNKTDVFTRTWGLYIFLKLNVNVEVFVMRKFLEWIKQEESGQGMVEYGVMLAIVVAVAVVVFVTNDLGGKIEAIFTGIDTDLQQLD